MMLALLNPRNLIVLAVVLAVAGAWGYGMHTERQRQALEDAKDHIETRDRIDEATSNPSGCHWADRLRGSCQ